MKKAIIFLSVALIVFLCKTHRVEGVGADSFYIHAGIEAAIWGLIAAFVPFLLPALRFASLIVRIPIWSLIILMYLIVGVVLGSILLFLTSIPILLGGAIGYLVIVQSVSVFYCIIIAICYLGFCIAIGKPLKKIIKGAANEFGKILKTLPPITLFDDRITEAVMDLHSWMKGKKES